MKQTSKLGLYKPEGDDIVEVEVLNSNFDIIDAAVAANNEKTDNIGESMDNINGKIGIDTDFYPDQKTLFGILKNMLFKLIRVWEKFDEDDNDSYICYVQNHLGIIKDAVNDMKTSIYEKIDSILSNTNIIPTIKSQTDKISDIQTKSQSINDAITAISNKSETTKYIECGNKEITAAGNLINITDKSGEFDLQFSFSNTDVSFTFTIDGVAAGTIKGTDLMYYLTTSTQNRILQGIKIKNSLKVDASYSGNSSVYVNYVFKRIS